MTDFLLFFINDKNVYILEGADSKKGGGRKGGWEVGDRGAGSGRGEICNMGED
jgi:hypothetical protein